MDVCLKIRNSTIAVADVFADQSLFETWWGGKLVVKWDQIETVARDKFEDFTLEQTCKCCQLIEVGEMQCRRAITVHKTKIQERIKLWRIGNSVFNDVLDKW